MKRFAIAFTVAMIAATGALAQTLSATPPTLKAAATVNADIVRLGDLFDNLGDKAETPVARSPQPGKRAVLDARWLANIAATYGIEWRPASQFDKLVLERASTTIGRDQIESALISALAAEGVAASAEIELASRDIQMNTPVTDSPTLAVRDVAYDERLNRFSATVEAPAGAPDAVRMRVQGRVFTVTEIPVLRRAMNKGQIIAQDDIEWMAVRTNAVRRDSVTDPDQLIGLAPRHQLRAGAQLRAGDVQRPVLVAKGSIVTMTLKTGAMSLTTQGRAIENGGAGDTVRISNTHTNIIVEAKVDGPNMVSVAPTARVLAN